MFKLVIPWGGANFEPKHYMTKLGRGALGNTTYQISKLHAFQFQRGRILKLVCFVPMFHVVTPGAGPILTIGASDEQNWCRFTRRCYIINIKALRLPVSEKKNFEVCCLSFYVPTCDPCDGVSFDPRGII